MGHELHCFLQQRRKNLLSLSESQGIWSQMKPVAKAKQVVMWKLEIAFPVWKNNCPYKVIPFPDVRGIWTFGIQNSAQGIRVSFAAVFRVIRQRFALRRSKRLRRRLKESRIPLTIGIRNPSSCDKKSRIQVLDSSLNPSLSCVTLNGAKWNSYSAFSKHPSSSEENERELCTIHVNMF